MTTSPFVVMAKPVGPRCNLNCSYCYYLGKPKLADAVMTGELLETYVRQYIEASSGPVVQFTWHGGEPTLASLDFYRKAVELQQRYLPSGWSCWNNLQTNGVLLDDSWCEFLGSAKFDVGLSIDGTQAVHDTYRKDSGGNGTYERALAAVKRLQSYGVQPDLLCTVTSTAANDPLAVYKALRRLGTGWIQFIPIIRRGADGAVTSDSVTPNGYGYFLKEIFDEWLLQDFSTMGVQLFAETLMVWSGGSASLCWMSPECGRAVVVEQDGSVYSCDHFVDVEHYLGNIQQAHLGELVDLPTQRQFGADKRAKLSERCRSCKWLKVCNGGCPKDRFDGDGASNVYYLCEGLAQFFAHAEQRLQKAAAFMKRGMDASSVMEVLRSDEAAKWKGIERNSPCLCGSGKKAKNCCWHKRVA